jgi:hypothetical protein
MRSALYYPHTEIRSRNLLKNSLLLWDKLEFIVPDEGYKPNYLDKQVAEAIEVIGRQRHPSKEMKKEAHEKIEKFATRKLPPVFYYQEGQGEDADYEIYPQKFMLDTWTLLREAQLTSKPLPNADYPMSKAAGLHIMSILADCMAGETRARITDRELAYAMITNLLVEERQPIEGSYETVVPLTLEAIQVSDLSLDRLIAFRKREDHEIRDLRHRYVDRIEDHIKAVLKLKKASDRQELERQFKLDMADDLKHLNDALGRAKKGALFSHDIIVTAVAAAGAFFGGLHLDVSALTLTGTAATVGGVLAAENKFATSRKSIMEKHPMAYLYQMEQFRSGKRWL